MFSTSKVEVRSFFLWFRRVFIIVLINDNLRVLRQWTHHHQHCNNSDDGAEQGRPPSVIVILVNQANKEFGAFFGPKKELNCVEADGRSKDQQSVFRVPKIQ